MRRVLGLVLMLAPCLARANKPEGRVDLLTYGEMMRLDPNARRAYVRDFGKLLASIEKQFEAKYDGASVADQNQRRGRVAALMRVLSAEEAFAAEAASPAAVTDEVPADAAKAGGQAPGAPWVTPPTPPAESPPFDVTGAKRTMPPLPNANCEIRPPECTPPTAAERNQLLLDFRSGPDTKCVAGGFFTSKKIRARAGSCEVKRSLKWGNETVDCVDASTGKTNGQDAMCNPFPFCIKYPDVKVSIKGKTLTTDIPITFCVKSGQDITERCVAKYNQILNSGKDQRTLNEFAKKPKIARQLKKAEACDGTFKGVSPPIADVYRELRNNTMQSYRDHCLSTANHFGKLFCKECGLIHAQLHAMLANVGHACVGGPSEAGDYEPPTRNYQVPTSQ